MPIARGGTVYHTGKRPATYDSRDIQYADIRASVTSSGGSLPEIKPFGGGYGTDFKNGPWPGWGMLGNGPVDDGTIPDPNSYIYNGAGDCAWAGPAHETMEAKKNAGATVPQFTSLNILNQYAQYLGLTDASELNSSNDQGSNVRDVLQIRATKGLLDASGTAHKIGVYVALEPKNLVALWEGLYFFEAVGIGIEFPVSAMDQLNQGKIWSVVPGAQIDGGHYIPIVGHPSANIWTCITWGQRQTMTPAFITKYCDEAWAYISAERYNAVTGETLEHYKDADLEKFITLVGQAQS